MSEVLIVDDQPEASEMLARLLRANGYASRVAPNGRDALDQVINHTPDLILLDLDMPQMDGVSLLQVLRSYLRWNTIPVLLVTALPREGPAVERARAAGVQGVFIKGDFALPDLLARVRDLTRRPGTTGGAA
jgi:two-component system KDP operon response regulator KdpE